MGMKGGIASSFLLISLVVALFIIIFDPTGALHAGEIEDIKFQKDTFVMKTALIAAKSFSETALDYSVYQAVYDYLQNDQKEIPDSQEAGSVLSEMIKENLDIYTAQNYNFLSNYQVSFPEYDVEVMTDPKKLTVNISSDQSLNIDKTHEDGEKIGLGKNPNVSSEYSINLEGIINHGKDVNTLVSQGLDTTIQYVISNLPNPTPEPDSGCGTSANLENDCITNAGYSSKDDIQDSIKTSVESSIESQRSSWEQSESFDVEAESLGTNAQVLIESSCDQGTILSCSFIYQVDSTLKVSVRQKDAETYPVFTGEKVESVPLELVFLIREQQTHPELPG